MSNSDVKFDKIIDFVVNNLELPIIDYQNEVIESRCPYCGDSKSDPKARRFRINYYPIYNTFMFYCFRCGETSNVISLLSYLKNIDYKEAEKILTNKKFDSDYITKKLSDSKKVVKKKETEFTIFDDFVKENCFSIDDNPEGRQDKRLVEKLKKFIKNRKVKTNCFICHSGKFKPRILIPIYNENNNIIYFQGRTIHDHIKPKYLNPTVEKDIILNSHNFNRDKYIIITEGLLDAFSVEYNQGTSILGAYIKDSLLELLLKKTDKGVIIALDNYKYDDQSVKTIKKFKENSLYYKTVKYFIFPDKYKVKDLNQLLIEDHIENIYDFVVKNSYDFSIFWAKFNSMEW